MQPSSQPLPTLKSATPTSNLKGLYVLLGDWAIISLSITTVVVSRFHPAVCIFAFLMISRSQFSIMLEGHEASHYLLLNNSLWNDFFGAYFAFGPTGIGLKKSRKLHWDHHGGLYKNYDVETEIHTLKKRDAKTFILHFVGPFLGGFLVDKVLSILKLKKPTFVDRTKVSSKEKTQDIVSIIISQAILIGILTWINPILYPLFWVAPLLTAGSLAHRIKAFCDHARLSTEDETYLYCVTPDWWDYLLLTMQQRDHGYHHLYPGVPYYHLEKVRNRPAPRHRIVQRKGYIRFLFIYFADLKNSIRYL